MFLFYQIDKPHARSAEDDVMGMNIKLCLAEGKYK